MQIVNESSGKAESTISENGATVLELTVNNHPGVMSQICGLFSRRVYNVEGILCVPLEGSDQSRIWLQVNENRKLEQVVKQLEKLHDVQSVVRKENIEQFPGIFAGIEPQPAE